MPPRGTRVGLNAPLRGTTARLPHFLRPPPMEKRGEALQWNNEALLDWERRLSGGRIWVSGSMGGKKKKLSMRTYSRVSVWCGWDLARGCARGVSLHVYLREPGSQCGWETLILHQCLRAWSAPGVGTTLHVSPPSSDQGLCWTLYNELLHDNGLRSHSRLSFSGLTWCSRTPFSDGGSQEEERPPYFGFTTSLLLQTKWLAKFKSGKVCDFYRWSH